MMTDLLPSFLAQQVFRTPYLCWNKVNQDENHEMKLKAPTQPSGTPLQKQKVQSVYFSGFWGHVE